MPLTASGKLLKGSPTPPSRSFSTTIPPMSRARPRAGSPRSPLAALPSRSGIRNKQGIFHRFALSGAGERQKT
jgi:hypothetical protein